MQLKRIYAFEVKPQRLADTIERPVGGAYIAPPGFVSALEEFLRSARLDEQAPISFRSHFIADGEHAQNEVRDKVRAFTFGVSQTAKAAASFLALRLSNSMDQRSASSLLVLTAHAGETKSRFVGWAFPKDEPYGFKADGESADLEIIQNAFSRSSSHRKAVMYIGSEGNEDFWKGNVIDKHKTVANYWVSTFLDSEFLIDSKSGTRMLANLLKDTHGVLDRRADKDQISASVLGVRASRRANWSIQKFANEYLSGDAKAVFLELAPPEALSAEFTLDRPELESRVNLRVFRLQDDVIVMAPFEAINTSVRLSGIRERKLKYEGIVVEESVRSQRAN